MNFYVLYIKRHGNTKIVSNMSRILSCKLRIVNHLLIIWQLKNCVVDSRKP